MEVALKTSLSIGYLVPAFPGQTHAFFWREAQAIEETGVPITFLSTRAPAPEDCPHPFGPAARARTTYVFPPRLGPTLHAGVTRPLRLARAMSYVLGLQETPVQQRLRLMALIPSAAMLVRVAAERGIGHLHVHSCGDAAHLAALAHILGDLPYSLTLHGDLEVYGRDHRAKTSAARFVSAVTRPLQAQLLALNQSLRVPVIWMGVDAAALTPAPRPPTLTRPIAFLSVARLNLTKGHVYFLRALRRLADQGLAFHYKIVGDGPYRTEIEAEIAALDLGAHVTLTGALGQDRVHQALQEADVFVLSSFGQGEAAPVAVMEAMAMGLPVICSRIGGTADMIEEGETGFLTPQCDVAALAEVAGRLARDEDLRLAVGGRARKAALEKFDYRHMARQLRLAIEQSTRTP